ncbi:hypothetical protein [Frankia sp. KB5]|uniref:hypothetical protein n=1 Tax=Frankia sp. KB5 TaxID=683318 RepID=UPI000A0F980A|nr:hypothetical protein [Frankia sp. KB5]ORT46685.1 hypothetical protein KBI5_23830 [Frankia sp. KB5]
MTVDYQETNGPAIDDVDLPGQVDAGLLSALVDVMPPRLFAIVAEPPDPTDIHVVAWGLRFDDQVAVVGIDGQISGSFSSLDRALWLFSYVDATLRVVWHSPSGPTRPHHPRRRITRLRR